MAVSVQHDCKSLRGHLHVGGGRVQPRELAQRGVERARHARARRQVLRPQQRRVAPLHAHANMSVTVVVGTAGAQHAANCGDRHRCTMKGHMSIWRITNEVQSCPLSSKKVVQTPVSGMQ